MSETLCTLRTKGGGGGAKYTETVLWQNPSPNTRMPASDSTASVNVTLSDSLSNYDYVKFVFKRNNGAYADVYTDVIYSVEEFKKYLAGTAYVFRGSIAAFAGNTGTQIIKKFSYIDDTTVMFVHTMSGTNSAGSYSQIIYDETLIPNQIIGINRLKQGTVQTARGSLTRGASDTTVNLGFEPSFIMLYKCSASATSTAVGDQTFMLDKAWSESSLLNSYKSSTSTGGQAFLKSSNTYITTTSTGFTFAGTSSTTYHGTYYYVAMGSTTE